MCIINNWNLPSYIIIIIIINFSFAWLHYLRVTDKKTGPTYIHTNEQQSEYFFGLFFANRGVDSFKNKNAVTNPYTFKNREKTVKTNSTVAQRAMEFHQTIKTRNNR